MFYRTLAGIEPADLKAMPLVVERVQKVKEMRLASTSPTTRETASRPTTFFTNAQPEGDYLLLPEVSSERRNYIPIGFMNKDVIASNKCLIIPNADIYLFGILTSSMHMAWMRYVSGRLELRYQYSASMVYNNFVFPDPSDKQKKDIETLAQEIIQTRKKSQKSNMAALYDPNTMPPELAKAHQKLDKVVEKAYGRTFDDDSQRVAYLFELYQQKCGELFVDTKRKGKGTKIKGARKV